MDASKIEEIVTFFDSDECIEAFHDIGKLKSEYKDKFVDLYNRCNEINGKTTYKGLSREETTRLKRAMSRKIIKSNVRIYWKIF